MSIDHKEIDTSFCKTNLTYRRMSLRVNRMCCHVVSGYRWLNHLIPCDPYVGQSLRVDDDMDVLAEWSPFAIPDQKGDTMQSCDYAEHMV